MNEKKHYPFEVRIHMAAPICLTYPFFHLDSILAHLSLRQLDPDAYRGLHSTKVDRSLAESAKCRVVPLKKTWMVMHGSASIMDISDPQEMTIFKRFCEQYLEMCGCQKRNKIQTSFGPYRNWMIRLITVPAQTVRFRGYGDRARAKELLEGLPSLGKKSSIGMGEISSIEVVPIEKDYSLIDEHGLTARTIPMDMCMVSDKVVNMAYQAPYWARENIKQCAPPGSRVVKRGEW